MDNNIYNIITNKISGEYLTSEQKQALQKWLLIDNNSVLYEELSKVWNLTSDKTYKVDIDVEKEWKCFNEKNKKAKIRTLYFSLASVAASILIVLGLFFILPSKITTYEYSQNNNHFILPDSSQVWLNNNTKITLTKVFGKKERIVNLIGQEAFFKVKKGKIPFVVNVNNKATAKVLGTSFNIKQNNKNINLQVATGLVEFGSVEKNNTIKVAKGGQAIYETEKNTLKKSTLTDLNTYSWATGEFVFDKENLKTVVDKLSDYLAIKIQIPAEFENKKFSGKFYQPTIKEVSDVFCKVFNFKSEYLNKKLIFKVK